MIPLFGPYVLRLLLPDDARAIFRSIDTQRAYLGRWLPFVALTLCENDSRAFVSTSLADPANPVYTTRADERFAGLIGFPCGSGGGSTEQNNTPNSSLPANGSISTSTSAKSRMPIHKKSPCQGRGFPQSIYGYL